MSSNIPSSLPRNPGPLVILALIVVGILAAYISIYENKKSVDETKSDLEATVSEIINGAMRGDMIVAHSADYESSCKLIFGKRLSPIEFSVSFPEGRCIYTINGGRVSHKEIFKLIGKDGNIYIIPKKNVLAARKAMLGMGANFQY